LIFYLNFRVPAHGRRPENALDNQQEAAVCVFSLRVGMGSYHRSSIVVSLTFKNSRVKFGCAYLKPFLCLLSGYILISEESWGKNFGHSWRVNDLFRFWRTLV
jgi:hypothetical protein